MRTVRALELRYLGQSSELAVPLVPGGTHASGASLGLMSGFQASRVSASW